MASLLLAALFAGCDNEELMAPEAPAAGDMFTRYVAIGNSITAGFQSGGINANLQMEAYPVRLAEQMGASFFVPELRYPGCPPPLTQIFPTTQRLEGGNSGTCALRQEPLPPFVSNVAVPGAEVIDALSNLDASSNANPLTTLFLGGRTQLQAALDADPTFASVWIGNNDVLGAALAGTTALVTNQARFTDYYSQILDGLESAENLQGGLLIGVADVTAVPALSAGQAYLAAIPAAQAAQVLPPNLAVSNSCAPASMGGVGDQTRVPFQHGATLIQVATALYQQLGQNAPTITLDCAQDRTVRQTVGAAFGSVDNIPAEIEAAIAGTANISLLTAQEIGTLAQAVNDYNTFIAAQADRLGWAYLNPNELFEANAQLIPPFPELVENDQTPWGTDQPFGPLFSLDGVHPSTASHRLLTDRVIATINNHYEDVNIPSLGS